MAARHGAFWRGRRGRGVMRDDARRVVGKPMPPQRSVRTLR
jgi:hypothetical protein